MEIDIRRVPFSRRGSYLAVVARDSDLVGAVDVVLRSLRGVRPGQDLFHLGVSDFALTSGRADAALLRLAGVQSSIEVCMADPTTVRLRADGGVVTISRPASRGSHTVIPLGRRSVEVALDDGWKYRVTALSGDLDVDAPWDGVQSARHIRLTARSSAGTGSVEMAIEEYQARRPPPRTHPPFERAVAAVRADFQSWLAATLTTPAAYAGARELCAYACWSTLVNASGRLHRTTMYASKNWMHGVWSWDHCFNAMALAATQPDLAWDQFMTIFDHIHPSGLLPDVLTDTQRGWSYCKPPVHGWTLRWLMRNSDVVTEPRLAEVYPLLSAWSRWWFRDRDDNGDGVPQYNHGNESGWDNSTAFMVGVPVDSPDLSAYLIVQLDTLAVIADRLGRADESREWTDRADRLTASMVERFAEGPTMITRRADTGDAIRHSSLLSAMPLVAGRRLPEALRAHILDQLGEDGPYLTPHGLATEAPSSAAYEADGYWRGPIWAPVTFLLTEAMRELGELSLADAVSRRFCDLVLTAGPAENFDALDGRGLRDPAFSWTASTFLLLAHKLQDAQTEETDPQPLTDPPRMPLTKKR